MKMAAVFLCLCAIILGANAYTVRNSPSSVLDAVPPSTEPLVDDSKCYYTLYLTDYSANGFGTVRAYQDGKSILSLNQDLSLPAYVKESGWEVPLAVNTTFSIAYTHQETNLNTTERGIVVLDVNGNVVFSRQALNSSFTVTIGQASCDCVYQETDCPSTRVRNEWRSLTYCEKRNFIDALRTFRHKTNEYGVNLYDEFISLHYVVTLPYIAAKNLLLPWHRLMLLQFETMLRQMGGSFSCIALPYWDWTMDFGHEFDSKVFAELGGIRENSCLDEPFADWSNPTLKQTCVYRRQSVSGAATNVALTARTAVDFGITTDDSYTFIFKYMVRAPHKAPHMFLEGDMRSFASPADPLFWLHHASVDRMWTSWQDCWDYDFDDEGVYQYSNISHTTVDTIMPKVYPDVENATVKSAFNVYKLGYTYPPQVDTLYRLNEAAAVTEPVACKWDWLSKDHQTNLGLSYRMPIHNDVQRETLSTIRMAYQMSLKNSGDYSQALLSQLKAECDLADANNYDKYIDLVEAADDPLPGPSYLFNNLCRIQFNGKIAELFIS